MATHPRNTFQPGPVCRATHEEPSVPPGPNGGRPSGRHCPLHGRLGAGGALSLAPDPLATPRAQARAHPEGLGELLQGGDGDGVRPWLSRPAEATSELLGEQSRQAAERGARPAPRTGLAPPESRAPMRGWRAALSQHGLPQTGLRRAYPLHIRLSGGGLPPAASATRSPADERQAQLGPASLKSGPVSTRPSQATSPTEAP